MSKFYNTSYFEIAVLEEIKEEYEGESLLELLAEENMVRKMYWRRIPNKFQQKMIDILVSEIEKRLK